MGIWPYTDKSRRRFISLRLWPYTDRQRVREPYIDKRQESNQFRNLAIYRQEADGVIILGISPYTDKKQAESNELSVWESCHFHQEADSLKFMNRLEASGE